MIFLLSFDIARKPPTTGVGIIDVFISAVSNGELNLISKLK